MEILDESPETSTALTKPLSVQGSIVFSDVHFQYPTRPDVWVLKGVDISIRPGEKVALAGYSGAGKSTIVQLLMKFYEWQKGSISVDGKVLKDWDLKELRSHIGIVPQEVLLFGGSIRENIAYAKPNATEEEIVDAARKANAWQFIEKFPEGLDTLVGERGVKLSGGQRQRIAIARAILKDPEILVLDEATSSLDAESEALVQEALDKLMKNRTTIVIAHRLATIRKVDRIYMLKEGQIVEEGDHETLSQVDGGYYAKLVKLQFTDATLPPLD